MKSAFFNRPRSIHLTAGLVLGSLLLAASPARAVIPVTVDAILLDSPGTVAFQAEMGQQLGALNKTAATEAADIRTLGLYMEGNGTGNGIIELLSANGQQLSRLNSFNDQYWDNYQQVGKDQALDVQKTNSLVNKYEQVKRLNESGVSTAACSDVTMAIAGGGGRANSRTQKAAGEHAVEERMGANRPQLAALADLIKDRSLFCSAEDAKNERPGCSSVGVLPGADLASSSLTMGAIDKSKPSSPTNRSFDANQIKAAQGYQNNILPLPAAQPQGSASQTAAGKQALAQFNRYQARWSVINDALGDMIAQHTPMPNAPDNWSENADAYKAMFPGQAFPDRPSESELLYFDAYQAYADPTKKSDLAVMDQPELGREQVRLAGIQNRLQIQTIENQEKEIKLLSVLVTQQMDPVTAATVRAGVPAGSSQ